MAWACICARPVGGQSEAESRQAKPRCVSGNLPEPARPARMRPSPADTRLLMAEEETVAVWVAGRSWMACACGWHGAATKPLSRLAAGAAACPSPDLCWGVDFSSWRPACPAWPAPMRLSPGAQVDLLRQVRLLRHDVVAPLHHLARMSRQARHTAGESGRPVAARRRPAAMHAGHPAQPLPPPPHHTRHTTPHLHRRIIQVCLCPCQAALGIDEDRGIRGGPARG